MPHAGWYYRLSQFFRENFGEKIYKIPLDAGFSCPNRDGTISTGGCIYCYNPGFSPASMVREAEGKRHSIAQQVLLLQWKAEKGKKERKNRITSFPDNFLPRKKYLAYFQAYTNTYGDVGSLQERYEEALSLPGIVGLSIATRPDCLSSEVLNLLESYSRDYHIWLEIGLQSSHNRTLERINRGHTFEQFVKAVMSIQKRGIYTCVHIINGLPGEKKEDMLETIRRLNSLPLQGIKFHQLQIMERTPLAQLYRRGEIEVLTEEEYLGLICDQLEILRGDIVVHRLLSEVTDRALLIAPRWHDSRSNFSRRVEDELKSRGTFQGYFYSTGRSIGPCEKL
ncbi:MAG: TIGR01212 family radical SAM protein [Firmicutes bacterium]|nr:TIGR01212 family radical SAM protein [Bacillota bacterium]